MLKNLAGKSIDDLSKFEAMEGEGYEITKDDSDSERADKQAIKLFNTVTEVFKDFDVE